MLPWAQLFSLEYAFIIGFGAVMNTRATLYLGLLNNFLTSVQFAGYAADTQTSYTNIMSGPGLGTPGPAPT